MGYNIDYAWLLDGKDKGTAEAPSKWAILHLKVKNQVISIFIKALSKG